MVLPFGPESSIIVVMEPTLHIAIVSSSEISYHISRVKYTLVNYSTSIWGILRYFFSLKPLSWSLSCLHINLLPGVECSI